MGVMKRMISSGQMGGSKKRFAEVSSMFFDAPRVLAAMERAQRKVLSRFGSYVRTTARSSLKRAPQKKIAELSETQLEAYRDKAAEAKEKGHPKPRRPEATSEPGEPPRLHIWPHNTNPLTKIFFGYDPDAQSVVVGPLPFKGQGASKLEHGTAGYEARPFMEPAFRENLPELPPMWQNSVKGW